MSNTDGTRVVPTDAERERFAGFLRDAVGAGILSLPEFEQRMDAVYAAHSLAELEELVRWLPAPRATGAAQGQPAPRRHFRLHVAIVGIAALVTITIAVAIGNAVRGSSGPKVPIITGVGVTYPFNDSRAFAAIHVRWPANTAEGMIQTAGYSIDGAPNAEVTDYTLNSFPVSYRAVACFVSCTDSSNSAGANLVFGPWYRPQVGNALGTPPPTLTVVPEREGYVLQIMLGPHQSASDIVIYRNGQYLTVTPNPDKGQVLQNTMEYSDNSGSALAANTSYAVAACYSDCWPTAIQDGFAQVTPRGPPASPGS